MYARQGCTPQEQGRHHPHALAAKSKRLGGLTQLSNPAQRSAHAVLETSDTLSCRLFNGVIVASLMKAQPLFEAAEDNCVKLPH
jgi:hypothetical protein